MSALMTTSTPRVDPLHALKVRQRWPRCLGVGARPRSKGLGHRVQGCGLRVLSHSIAPIRSSRPRCDRGGGGVPAWTLGL